MKKVISFLMVMSFIVTGACCAVAGEIGFVSMKDVLLHSDAGKAATEDLKKFVEERKGQIQEKEDALQKLKDNLEKQRPVLTDSAYKEMELSYQKEYRDYKRFIEDTNEEMKTMDQDLSRKLLPEVLKVINTIGEKGGYTSIMDVNSGGLVFHSKANDITQKVIEEYNKVYNGKK